MDENYSGVVVGCQLVFGLVDGGGNGGGPEIYINTLLLLSAAAAVPCGWLVRFGVGNTERVERVN